MSSSRRLPNRTGLSARALSTNRTSRGKSRLIKPRLSLKRQPAYRHAAPEPLSTSTSPPFLPTAAQPCRPPLNTPCAAAGTPSPCRAQTRAQAVPTACHCCCCPLLLPSPPPPCCTPRACHSPPLPFLFLPPSPRQQIPQPLLRPLLPLQLPALQQLQVPLQLPFPCLPRTRLFPPHPPPPVLPPAPPTPCPYPSLALHRLH